MMGLCGCAADRQPKNLFVIMQQFSVFIDVQCTYTPLKYVWFGLFLARNHDNHFASIFQDFQDFHWLYLIVICFTPIEIL